MLWFVLPPSLQYWKILRTAWLLLAVKKIDKGFERKNSSKRSIKWKNARKLKKSYVLPRMPSMVWFDRPSSEVHPSVWPPRRTREILETLGALFLSQTISWSSKERKNKTLCLIVLKLIKSWFYNIFDKEFQWQNFATWKNCLNLGALFLSQTTSWSSKERKCVSTND